jgi:hypothetical protein
MMTMKTKVHLGLKTVQDSRPDFEFKLQIETGRIGCGHRTALHRYLIRHRHREETWSEWEHQKRTL